MKTAQSYCAVTVWQPSCFFLFLTLLCFLSKWGERRLFLHSFTVWPLFVPHLTELLQVELQWLHIHVKAQRRHGKQDVLPIDGLPLLLMATFTCLWCDEADELAHTLLHALLGIFCNLRQTDKEQESCFETKRPLSVPQNLHRNEGQKPLMLSGIQTLLPNKQYKTSKLKWWNLEHHPSYFASLRDSILHDASHVGNRKVDVLLPEVLFNTAVIMVIQTLLCIIFTKQTHTESALIFRPDTGDVLRVCSFSPSWDWRT